MEQMVLKASRRNHTGTKHARRERAKGSLPAVIYGHGEPPEAVSLNTHDALLELQHGARVLSVQMDGARAQYLIKDVQYDYLGTHPIHLDLMRVERGEKVRVKVAVELRGTPAGLADGGVLEHAGSEIEVECQVIQIPESIQAHVKHLQVGEALLAGDLELPPGVTLLSDSAERIAAVRVVAEAAPDVEAEEESAQPELIGRPKTEEPSEETKE